MKGPFYNLNDAARYCGYSSGDSFRKALQDENIDIQRYGFKNKSRYAMSDLDILMTTPEVFKKDFKHTGTRRRAKISI